MKYKQKFSLLLLVTVVASMLGACYFGNEIKANQQGLALDANAVRNCVGPGVYTDAGFYTDMWEIATDTLTFEVTDGSVATKDTQIVGITLQIQARRNDDCPSLTLLFTKYQSLLNDDNLKSTIGASASEAIKIAVRGMTLDQLLNDREGLSTGITDFLNEDTAKYGAVVTNISIKDVQLNAEYEALLVKKANLTAQIELAERQQDLFAADAAAERIRQEEAALTSQAQLLAEQAKTAVEVEIAEREGDKIAAQFAVYNENERAYELRRLELLQKVLGDKAAVYFVDSVEDLMVLLGGSVESPVIPVPVDDAGGQ